MAYVLGPTGAPAYAAIMEAVGVCPECGQAVLLASNDVALDPPVVSHDTPGAMALMLLAVEPPLVLAASTMAGQPAHGLHAHQPHDVAPELWISEP